MDDKTYFVIQKTFKLTFVSIANQRNARESTKGKVGGKDTGH